jgi:HlyD family secretion protein
MMALRGAEGSDADRQSRIQKTREATRARIREILTPEQQRRYDEMSPSSTPRSGGGLPGRVWVVGPDGKPAAVSVILGISDGSATEIVRGDVKEGQEVIVGAAGGTAPRAPGQGATPPGPRLRL